MEGKGKANADPGRECCGSENPQAVTEHRPLGVRFCLELQCFELAQAWMADAREHYRVGDTTLVRIHKIQEAGGKLSITVEENH